MKSLNPIIFGVATAIIFGAVILVSSDIWQAIKREKESKHGRF